MNGKMIEILDRALERVREGEPIPTVLAAHRQAGEELRPLLETSQALSLLSQVTMPPAEALREDKNAFLANLGQLQQQPVSRSPLVRLKGWVSRHLSEIRGTTFARQRKERGMSALLGKAILIVAIGLGTLGGTVAAADSSLPGSPVYGVKLSLEDLRLAVARESQADVDLYIRFAQARVREMARLVESGRAPDDAILSRLQLHLESALQLAGQMPEEARLRQMVRIREAVRDQEQEMEHLQEHAAEPLRQHLRETRRYLQRLGREIEAGLQQPQEHRWQNMENRPEGAPIPQEAGPNSGGQNNQPDLNTAPGGNSPGPGGSPEQPDDPVCRQNDCQPAGDGLQEQHHEQNQEEHHYGQEGEQPGPSGDPHGGNGNGPGNDAQQDPGHGQDDGGGMGPGPGDGSGEPAQDDGGNGGDGQGEIDGGGGGKHGSR